MFIRFAYELQACFRFVQDRHMVPMSFAIAIAHAGHKTTSTTIESYYVIGWLVISWFIIDVVVT